MSYRCCIGAELAAAMGLEAGGPWLKCDGCGLKLEIRIRRGGPPKWFLDNRPAPGWKLVRNADGGTRLDWCPACRGRASSVE